MKKRKKEREKDRNNEMIYCRFHSFHYRSSWLISFFIIIQCSSGFPSCSNIFHRVSHFDVFHGCASCFIIFSVFMVFAGFFHHLTSFQHFHYFHSWPSFLVVSQMFMMFHVFIISRHCSSYSMIFHDLSGFVVIFFIVFRRFHEC